MLKGSNALIIHTSRGSNSSHSKKGDVIYVKLATCWNKKNVYHSESAILRANENCFTKNKSPNHRVIDPSFKISVDYIVITWHKVLVFSTLDSIKGHGH
jgi:hypothetical protein